MIILPFVYFTIWALVSLKKYGVSVGTYVLSIYAFSSFCSILIDSLNLYENDSVPNVDVGFIAPGLYILLLTFCLKPIYNIGVINIKPPTKRVEAFLKFLSVAYLLMFIIVLIVAYERIIFVLASDSLANIRNEQYTGETVSFYDYLSGIRRYICAFFSVIAQSSYIMLMAFCYLMAFSKCNMFFKISSFIGSLTPLLISINIADRSNYFYWLIMMGFSIVIFYRYFPKRNKVIVGIVLSLALFAVLFYFISVTNSRFGERENGSSGGLILYAGQSYHNFCRFINYLDPPNTVNIIFPNITTYLFHGDNYFSLAHKIEALQHIPLCVFPTFLGIILSVSGYYVTLLFILFFCGVAYRFQFSVINRSVSIGKMFVFWCWAIVPTIGVITYFYLNSGGTTALILWLFMSKILNNYDK